MIFSEIPAPMRCLLKTREGASLCTEQFSGVLLFKMLMAHYLSRFSRKKNHEYSFGNCVNFHRMNKHGDLSLKIGSVNVTAHSKRGPNREKCRQTHPIPPPAAPTLL